MKHLSLFALCLTALVFFGIFNQTIQFVKCTVVSKCLAIIVLGSDEFAGASERCFDLMSKPGCYEILYLSANPSLTPRANMEANRTNLEWAFSNWLKSKSTSEVQVWIWIFSHGLGLHHQPPGPSILEGWWLESRAEVDSDEGPEITEYLIGEDVNGDGEASNSTWVGVDECILLYPPSGEEIVWDDELREWLDGYWSSGGWVSTPCARTVVFMSTCRGLEASENETSSCYGGGFIDDLSAPRRIIMSCTNETYYGWANHTTGIGFFAEPFMNALDPDNPAWDEAKDTLDADGIPSVLEAYRYAFEHDMARKAVRTQGFTVPDPWQGVYPNWQVVDESPWMDDGGNFLPTFRNGSDMGLGAYGYDEGDRWLARYTWIAPGRYSGCVEDINDDFVVDMKDLYMAVEKFATTYYGEYWEGQKWDSKASLADINHDNNVGMKDIYGISLKYGWTGY